jgi:hypothetical protein
MRSILVSVLGLAAACSHSTGPSDPVTALALARAKWFQAEVSNYQYTILRGCECLPESIGPVVIEVRDNTVQNRRYLTGTAVDPQFADLFAAVPGLFDLIEEAIHAPAAGLAVRYNPAYGYPESIQIDWVAGVVDDEVSYHITDFVVLTAR